MTRPRHQRCDGVDCMLRELGRVELALRSATSFTPPSCTTPSAAAALILQHPCLGQPAFRTRPCDQEVGLLGNGSQAAAGHQSVREGSTFLSALRLGGGETKGSYEEGGGEGEAPSPTPCPYHVHTFTHTVQTPTVFSAPRKGAICRSNSMMASTCSTHSISAEGKREQGV